jgi:hypothetical protein
MAVGLSALCAGRALTPEYVLVLISIKMMFLGCKVRPVRKAEKLAAVCEPTVYTVWDP